MRKIQTLLTLAFLFLLASHAVAQEKAPSDGTIIEQTPCAPSPVVTYGQYVEGRKRRLAEEVELAKGEGFRMEMPKDFTPLLLTEEQFAKHKAYAGFECLRIKYMSD